MQPPSFLDCNTLATTNKKPPKPQQIFPAQLLQSAQFSLAAVSRNFPAGYLSPVLHLLNSMRFCSVGSKLRNEAQLAQASKLRRRRAKCECRCERSSGFIIFSKCERRSSWDVVIGETMGHLYRSISLKLIFISFAPKFVLNRPTHLTIIKIKNDF